jgi:hypothetical protein
VSEIGTGTHTAHQLWDLAHADPVFYRTCNAVGWEHTYHLDESRDGSDSINHWQYACGREFLRALRSGILPNGPSFGNFESERAAFAAHFERRYRRAWNGQTEASDP